MPGSLEVAGKTLRLLSIVPGEYLQHCPSGGTEWGGCGKHASFTSITSILYFHKGDDKYSGQEFERTLIINMKLPKMGMKRRVVFSTDQLIMSFGGAIGLFLGASFMTIYGLIYLFLTFIAYKCKHSLFKKQ